MDVPAPGFPAFGARDTQGSTRESCDDAATFAARIARPATDPVALLQIEELRAGYRARALAPPRTGSSLAQVGRAMSQTVRANFDAADVFERSGDKERPRQAAVFAPIAGDDEKNDARETSKEDRATAGEDAAAHGSRRGLGRRLNGLLGRKKDRR